MADYRERRKLYDPQEDTETVGRSALDAAVTGTASSTIRKRILKPFRSAAERRGTAQAASSTIRKRILKLVGQVAIAPDPAGRKLYDPQEDTETD